MVEQKEWVLLLQMNWQKNEEFNICFLSLWEKQENSFFDIAQNIKRYKLFQNEVSGKKY